jgi:hypothetical protein
LSTLSNFKKETLTFEVVGFHGTYHAILGCPCYTKFMAIPNYTYLKLKMSGPKGVITVEPSYEHALAKEILDPKRRAGNFEPVEDIKLVPLDPASSDERALKVSATLDPK